MTIAEPMWPATKSVWLAVFVRTDETVFPAANAATWTKVIDGEGGNGLFLDGYARDADGTAGSLEGDDVSFFSPTTQELQGTLVTVPNAVIDDLIFSVQTAAILLQDDPEAPEVPSYTQRDMMLALWSLGSVVTATTSEGLTELDTFTSVVADDGDRTFIAGTMVAGSIGQINPGNVVLSATATGRSWSVCIKFSWRGSRHLAPIQTADDTNSSVHSRTT